MVKIARYIFSISGIYGILILTPQLFRESAFSTNGVPLSHPEFFYGFFLLALAFQILFIIISTNPVRYRSAMLPCFIEKAGHAISCIVLFMQHRLAKEMFLVSMGDVLMLLLFIYSYVITAPRIPAPGITGTALAAPGTRRSF
jgi:hypothetical protein